MTKIEKLFRKHSIERWVMVSMIVFPILSPSRRFTYLDLLHHESSEIRYCFVNAPKIGGGGEGSRIRNPTSNSSWTTGPHSAIFSFFSSFSVTFTWFIYTRTDFGKYWRRGGVKCSRTRRKINVWLLRKTSILLLTFLEVNLLGRATLPPLPN